VKVRRPRRALGPRSLAALAFRSDQKANAKGNGEAQNHWIKIEHLLLYARARDQRLTSRAMAKAAAAAREPMSAVCTALRNGVNAVICPLMPPKIRSAARSARSRAERLRNFGQEK